MKFIIQRVKEASVTVDNQIIGSIETGYLVFIGVSHNDTTEIADKMLQKMLKLRIFSDDADKINLSLTDVSGQLLMISQFTLYADCKKGNRPSFFQAGKPDLANFIYEYLVKEAKKQVSHVATGSFGADMKVSLLNDGPFTIVLDSAELGYDS